MVPTLIADIPPDEIFPFLLGAIVLLIPIVAMLTAHQQKMARLIRGESTPGVLPQNDDLRREVEALRQIVMQQTIAIDSLVQQQRTLQGEARSPSPQES